MNNNNIVPGFDDEKGDNLSIRLQKVDEITGCLVLYLVGYIGEENHNYFQERIAMTIASGFTKLIFHCAELNILHSLDIAGFLKVLQAVKSVGGELVLLDVQPKSLELFKDLVSEDVFNFKDSLCEAVQFFQHKGDNGTGALFPIIVKCPVCSKKLKSGRSGRFRCSECKTVLAIDENGQVFIG